MRYRFYGDELQLIRYELEMTETRPFPNIETGEFGEREYTQIYSAASEEEKNELVKHYPNAVVTEIDNAGYEWLDGRIFTQEQLRAGELEKAIELGEEKYAEYLMSTDRDAQMLDMDYRISLLELGVTENDLSAM